MSAELIGISRDMLIPKSKINNKMDTYSNRARKHKQTEAERKSRRRTNQDLAKSARHARKGHEAVDVLWVGNNAKF